MGGWAVLGGPASMDLARRVSEKLSAEYVEADCRIFADGESKVRISADLRNRRVIILQSLYPPADRHFMQLVFLSHKLSEDGAEVNIVTPYLAYARQDREFIAGEVVSLGVLAHLIRSVGAKRLVAVDIHSVRGLGYFSIPAFSVSAIPYLADYFKGFKMNDAIAVSPDIGGFPRVEAFASRLGIGFRSLEKNRDRTTGQVKISEENLQLGGKDVILVDDIISTGGSVLKAVNLLKIAGAGRIYVTCVHHVMSGDSLDKIRAAGVEEVVATNTIPGPISKVDVSGAIASYFQSLD